MKHKRIIKKLDRIFDNLENMMSEEATIEYIKCWNLLKGYIEKLEADNEYYEWQKENDYDEFINRDLEE